MSALGLLPTIVRLTLFEALRRRTLWALVLLTLVVVVLSGVGFQYLVNEARAHDTNSVQLQAGVSQMLILCAFMFSFILATTAAFLGAPSLSGDIESGVLLAMLARPLSRGMLVAGRWLGLVIVVAGYGAACGLLEIGALWLASGYGPPDPIGAVLALAGQGIVVLTVSLLLSSRLPAIASGAVSVVAFGLAWGVGVMGGVGTALGVDSLEKVSQLVRVLYPSDGLWRATIFALEPSVVIALISGDRSLRALAANPFFAGTGPSPIYLAWCLAWVVGILGLAIVSFRRREI